MNKPFHVFFHGDLDGITSYLEIIWFLKREATYTEMTPATVEREVEKWKTIHNVEDFEKIFILDLDAELFQKNMDYGNVVIFDHHIGKEEFTFTFKNAKVFVKHCTSNARHMYDFLKDKIKLTENQKILIALADDVDSHSKKIPTSYELNVVFHKTNNKITSFIENYKDGFFGFDKFQKNIIELHKKEVALDIANTTYYCGDVEVQGKMRKVFAAFVDRNLSEISDFLIEKHKADVTIMIIKDSHRVSFRRGDDSKDLNLDILSKSLCGEGSGGHEYAAGGQMSDKFLTFTKLFKEVNLI